MMNALSGRLAAALGAAESYISHGVSAIQYCQDSSVPLPDQHQAWEACYQ
jgi:hypothetical protein